MMSALRCGAAVRTTTIQATRAVLGALHVRWQGQGAGAGAGARGVGSGGRPRTTDVLHLVYL